MAEGFLPDLPLPDVLVPVHPRAEVGLGVVQVENEVCFTPTSEATSRIAAFQPLGVRMS